MNKAQEKSLNQIKKFLQEQASRNAKEGAQVTHLQVAEYGTFISVSAQIELLGLPEGNLLRALAHDFYHIFIGARGAKKMVGGPKSFQQFNGKRVSFAGGMKVRLS